MSNVKFNALASLALLAGAPVVAQAEMVEMADAEMSDVSGEGVVGFQRWAPFTFTDVLPTFVDGDPINLALVFNPANIFNTSYGAANTAVGAAGNAAIGFGLLPITAPTSAVAAFNARVVSNFAITGQSVADTASRILTTPIRAVVNPINGALDDAAALGKGLVSGARFSAVGAVGGVTTRVLAGAAQQTNSRLLTNLAYASDQARVQQQANIGKTLGVTVTVPKYTVSTSLLAP